MSNISHKTGILLNRTQIQLDKSKITTFSIKILNVRHFWMFLNSIASIPDQHLSSPATFHSFYIIFGQNRPHAFSKKSKQNSKKEETLLKEDYSRAWLKYNTAYLEVVHLTLPPHIFFRPSKVMEHVTSRLRGEEFKTKQKKPNPNPNS